jgi:hypothetical protein
MRPLESITFGFENQVTDGDDETAGIDHHAGAEALRAKRRGGACLFRHRRVYTDYRGQQFLDAFSIVGAGGRKNAEQGDQQGQPQALA